MSNSTSGMSNNGISPITQFRISYLRAIADVWENENGEYANQLIWRDPTEDYSDPKKQEQFDIFRPNSELKYFTYANPWNVVINIVFREKGPMFNGTSWGGPVDTDKFIIYLPTAPKDKSVWEEALFAYYQQFPTLFGNSAVEFGYPQNTPPTPQVLKTSSSVKSGSLGNIGISGTEPIDFINFGGTTLKIIANTWNDEEFKKEIAQPTSQKALEESIQKVESEFCNTWKFDLEFKFDQKAKYVENNGIYDWIDLPKNIIQLNFPHKPFDSGILKPLALAAYNATGAEYCLTCY